MSSASTPLVWYHSASEGSARLVLLAIADHDGEGGAWPSVATLARMAAVSESTVVRARRTLVALGELEVHEQQGGNLATADHLRPNRYEINLACPDWCDGSARHACRLCGGKGQHKAECAATDPDAPIALSTGVSPVTPPPLSTGVSPVTPLPVSLVTPEPPKEAPTTSPAPPAPTVPESVARLWREEGISDEDQDALWAEVIADPETTVPAARARQRAWFVPALAKIHAKSSKDRSAALAQLRRYGDPCEHDEPAGAEPHPVTGLPLCPLCRTKAARS
jgi:hypothetical protein